MEILNTLQAVLTLVLGFIGLISTAISTFVAVKAIIASNKGKSLRELWTMIMSWADEAMKAAEVSKLSGADKKAYVIEAVKAAAKAAGANIDEFMDQLSAYIDQTITFVNDLTK